MRTRMMLAVLAATIIVAPAADNSLGTWKRNVEKTKYNPMPPNPIKSFTLVREAAGDSVKVTVKGQRADGTPLEATYNIKYDGKPVMVTGGGSQFDSTLAKQLDANTFTGENRKTGGKYHTTSKTVISKDGKTMTTTAKGTDAEGKPISFTIVYDKQ